MARPNNKIDKEKTIIMARGRERERIDWEREQEYFKKVENDFERIKDEYENLKKNRKEK